MLRFYARFALIPTALLTALLLLIHAQPYDDHELRELLLPDSCPAPCFMGIRPGMTTMDEAQQILRASSWTKDVKRIEDSLNTTIEWYWSEAAPQVLNREFKNDLEQFRSQTLVEIMNIHITYAVGDIYLLLGEPYVTDSGAPGRTTENEAYVSAKYPKQDLFISSLVYCPVSKERFLDSQPTITLMTPDLISSMTGFSSIDFFC